MYISNSYWFTCIAYYQKTGNKKELQNGYNQVGFNYSVYDEYEQALTYFLKSYEISVELNDIDGMSSSLINSGYSYEMMGDDKQALSQYHKSLVLHQEMGVEEYVAYSFVLMGTIFAKLNQLDSSLFYLQLSDEILTRQSDDYGLSYVYYGYALLYEKTGNLQLGEKYARDAVNYSKRAGFLNNELKGLSVLQEIKTAPKKNAKSINFSGEDCFHVKQIKEDWMEITTKGVCTDEQLTTGTLDTGWIR